MQKFKNSNQEKIFFILLSIKKKLGYTASKIRCVLDSFRNSNNVKF